MNRIKFVSLIIILLIPHVVLLIELYKYKQLLHHEIMSLVITNFIGFFPASQTLYYTFNSNYMLHEFVLFYLITFNSGTYHLCNKLDYVGLYCKYLPRDVIMYMDYVNSYFCIIATILYLAKFEFISDRITKNMVKFTIYCIEYVIVFMLTINTETSQLPSLFISLTLIVVLLVFVSNRNKYVELYFNEYRAKIFIIGIIFSAISFVTYLYIAINNLQNSRFYWIYHSYMWHVPILLSPVFIIEASTTCEKSFFRWIYELDKSNNEEQIYEFTDCVDSV